MLACLCLHGSVHSEPWCRLLCLHAGNTALLNCNDQLELRLDGDECTAATLKSTSEDLKDLKKQNKQVCGATSQLGACLMSRRILVQ